MVVEKEFPWGSLHSTGGWNAQLARIHRWRARLQNATEPADILDFLFALFQNFYHLRDWLPSNEFPADQVRDFLNTHQELRICRDLCNMTKHFELSHPPAQGYEPSILREYAPGRLANFEKDSRLVIVSGGKKHDAQRVAFRCVELWTEFLSVSNAP